VGESGMIRTQMGKHSSSAMVAVYGTPCAIPPRNSDINSKVVHVLKIKYRFIKTCAGKEL
jgi:hypothetical protein